MEFDEKQNLGRQNCRALPAACARSFIAILAMIALLERVIVNGLKLESLVSLKTYLILAAQLYCAVEVAFFFLLLVVHKTKMSRLSMAPIYVSRGSECEPHAYIKKILTRIESIHGANTPVAIRSFLSGWCLNAPFRDLKQVREAGGVLFAASVWGGRGGRERCLEILEAYKPLFHASPCSMQAPVPFLTPPFHRTTLPSSCPGHATTRTCPSSPAPSAPTLPTSSRTSKLSTGSCFPRASTLMSSACSSRSSPSLTSIARSSCT